MYEQYRGRAAFFVIYIQEAHPTDAWHDEDNVRDKIAVASEKSLNERCAVAETCVTKLNIHIPALIDDLGDSTEAAYSAWPDRLYVIDGQQRIAFKSGPGPYGFHPEGVAQALSRLVPPVPARAASQTSRELPKGGRG